MPIVGREHLDEIVERVLRGEVVAMPTDTVYGLATRADDDAAVHRLAELKGRDPRQPIAVLFDAVADIEALIDPPPDFGRLAAFWPGALTMVVRARPGAFASALTPEGSIGIRQPDDDLARELLRRCGGVLAVTSANPHGEAAAASADAVAAMFGDALLILDGGARGQVASTVIDLTSDPPKVLREGVLTAAALGLEVG